MVKKKKDIFKEPLHPIEGIQDFTKKASKDRLKILIEKKKERGKFCVVKEEKPRWYTEDMKWRQTYSIQRKDKMKELGVTCK